MPNKRLMLQLKPEATDALKEIPETVENSGGRVLPAPLIFPPLIHFSASEAVATEIKNKYVDNILRIMVEESEED
ncbi:hypothetical protein N7491_000203 [Penicillium cf. griseofulvum]|uniref:Uncharacterized protein n=1 Tax=Penicillium cf. griseofulvum TaxID=2972120 RepID=A0A9W9MDK9_9EURO|nr:hypothetical protein N7472_004445 [Penicillium cf. griseofulvum]KAJ5451021.1 hypothetical protein N7491_000203 [Penicillium cf. griseofulvum]